MVNSASKQRRLMMHPAHRMVGVRQPYGDLAEAGRFGRWRVVAPPRVLVAIEPTDAESQQAATLFERIAQGACDAECRRIGLGEIAWVDRADCFVSISGGCCQMARRGAMLVSTACGCEATAPLMIEPMAAAVGHPVLEGVGPFQSAGPVTRIAPPSDAVLLLDAKTVSGMDRVPVAWVRDGRAGRAFCAAMASAADFRLANYARLIGNALGWIGRKTDS